MTIPGLPSGCERCPEFIQDLIAYEEAVKLGDEQMQAHISREVADRVDPECQGALPDPNRQDATYCQRSIGAATVALTTPKLSFNVDNRY